PGSFSLCLLGRFALDLAGGFTLRLLRRLASRAFGSLDLRFLSGFALCLPRRLGALRLLGSFTLRSLDGFEPRLLCRLALRLLRGFAPGFFRGGTPCSLGCGFATRGLSPGLFSKRVELCGPVVCLLARSRTPGDIALCLLCSGLGFSIPIPAVDHVFSGFEYLGAILVTAIPFGIYDLVEAMDNVESAEAAGDAFPTTRVLTADGVVSLIGALMGNPFINAVYIGHPGWKAMGGRIGYSAATGVMVIVLSWLGIISLLLDLIPLVAISPIL